MSAPRYEATLMESLQRHCFDMRVVDMRAIIAQAAGPPEVLDSKSDFIIITYVLIKFHNISKNLI